jgi:hypothetical protein
MRVGRVLRLPRESGLLLVVTQLKTDLGSAYEMNQIPGL